MSVGPQSTTSATTAPGKKPAVRWVGDPTTGHWVDEDGNPAESPAAGTQTQAAAPNPNVNGSQDPLSKWAGSDQSSGTDPFHNPDKGATTVGQVPAAAPAPAPADGLTDAANRARQLADAAMNRTTDPGALAPSTAQGVGTVDRTGTTQAPATVQVAPRTAVPNPIQVDRIGGAPIANAPTVTAQTVASPEISQSGAALQFAAAQAYQDMLSGKSPSLAELQLKDAQDKATAEQLSIAAGARGQGVVAARRNAATNIGLQQMEAGGQAAELRAKEIADAAAGLGTVGGAVQGQNLAASAQLTDTQKTNAANTLQAGTVNAGNTIDVSKANAANAIDVSKTNQATDLAVKQSNAANQLKADISSDDRIQNSLNLAAELQQRAAAGDQSAAVQLNSLGAQLQTDVAKFNAQQIQTANGQNIENRLRAMGMDDQFVEQTTALWVQAENAKDQNALDRLKVQLQQQAADNQKKGGFLSFLSNIFGTGATIIGGLLGGPVGAAIGGAIGKGVGSAISGGTDSDFNPDENGDATLDANGDPILMSDRRLKEDVRKVSPSDVDGFLRAVGKTQTWEYKPGEGLPAGRKLGPMAQDLAADKLASEAVGQRPDGKMSLDYQHLGALALAGLGRLNDCVEAVESVKPRGKARPDVNGFVMAVKGRR